ncbi:hypothetical protein ANANG_G00041850 [Anguilla anguilla]|uniref:Uncharacterized protein n=1 Tax=Anguilla anguilla TaxID=7936 RepID=A0A9D3MTY0_ANGAN|nr:hypothetical protein ANANG_G00041850 [Anguilla anguilla]
MHGKRVLSDNGVRVCHERSTGTADTGTLETARGETGADHYCHHSIGLPPPSRPLPQQLMKHHLTSTANPDSECPSTRPPVKRKHTLASHVSGMDIGKLT